MRIVKCELLWTRQCPLSCSYCGMKDGRANEVPLYDWIRGIDNLAKLGCKFIAIYGAEPLCDSVGKLGGVIEYAEALGICCSVITSGCVSDIEGKLSYLYSKGLRSLTVSDDLIALPGSSKKKSRSGHQALEFFRSLGPYRDLAATATLTRLNFHALPEAVQRLSDEGIWLFWDLIHYHRGQPGSKCKPRELVADLTFGREDFDDLGSILEEVARLKDKGCLVHHSRLYLDALRRDNWQLLRLYNWNCARNHKVFPAWVTVDCDGAVFPCDDFQVRGHETTPLWELDENWEEWCQFQEDAVEWMCAGCAWNTHMDATWIKEGSYDIGEYVHGLDARGSTG